MAASLGPNAGAASKAGVSGVADLLVEAVAAHQHGQLDEAAGLYGEVLEATPNNPDALHLLGVLRHQAGDSMAGLKLIDRAISFDGQQPLYHANRATALQTLGRAEEAIEGYRRAIALDPVNAEANAKLGNLLNDLGQAEEAIRCYEMAIRFDPRVRSVHKNLALLYLDENRFDDAVELFQRYLETSPDDAEANSNYGYALEQLGRPEEALPFYRKAHEHAPGSAEICSNLGNVLAKLGHRDEAEHYLGEAAVLAPENPTVLSNHSQALLAAQKFHEAVPVLRRLVELEPEVAAYHHDLGVSLENIGRSSEALAAFVRADELEPKNVGHLTNLGITLTALTRYREAAQVYKRAIEAADGEKTGLLNGHLCVALRLGGCNDEANVIAHATMELPDWEPRWAPALAGPFRSTCDFDGLAALGDLVATCEGLIPDTLMGAFLDLRSLTEDLETDRRVSALHVKWGDAQMAKAEANPLPPRARSTRGGKIRLGFLSSDLRTHAVAKFLKAVFDHYDRNRFEIYAYTQFDLPGDPMQVELKRTATAFRLSIGMTHREVAAMIRDDDVDILFELNGATLHSQLSSLAWRPAPVQISWLGYGGTTGLRAVDYALVDRFSKPTEPGLWVEQFLEMKDAWVSFSDYPEIPIAADLPSDRNGFVTFGTMNANYKYTPAIIALWSRILESVPGSRMLFVRPEFNSVTSRVNLVKEFAKHGIPAERIFFIANPPGQYSHLVHYNEIDIALDTYPAAGSTTSCDTLWMGVPIVGRYGPNMHQRLNHTILNHVGLEAYSVPTAEAYVEAAISLANDPDRRRMLHQNIRGWVKESPICNPQGFTNDFQDRMMELVERHKLR